MERQLNTKSKQFSADDRLNHTLVQQSDAYIARKKLEQIRLQTMNEQIEQLIEENLRLKTLFDYLSKKLQPEVLIDLQEKITDLKQFEEKYQQERSHYDHEKVTIANIREYYQRKTHGVSLRMNPILKRLKRHEEIDQENTKYLVKIEDQINQEQTFFFQSQTIFKDLQKRSESQQKKRHSISTQLQIASNNIQ